MPNLKVYIDRDVRDGGLPVEARKDLRNVLIDRLGAPPAACQIAVLPVQGLPDQPAANIELALMPGPERTVEVLTELGQALQSVIRQHAEVDSAFRCTLLDPESYVTLK